MSTLIHSWSFRPRNLHLLKSIKFAFCSILQLRGLLLLFLFISVQSVSKIYFFFNWNRKAFLFVLKKQIFLNMFENSFWKQHNQKCFHCIYFIKNKKRGPKNNTKQPLKVQTGPKAGWAQSSSAHEHPYALLVIWFWGLVIYIYWNPSSLLSVLFYNRPFAPCPLPR